MFSTAGENIERMPKTLNLKSTLNLPKTAFPMKANLPQNEPRMLAEWEDSHLYQRIQQARAGARSYVLHDGPPYPTGTIHLGTGLNKIVKDMVVKSKTMAGFRSPYVPGWDCHGLPIETQVEKELGKKGNVSPAEFRRMCREFALRYVDQHRRDFKRLGVFGRWEKPYLTMDPHNEASIAGAFLTFLEKGYIYRGLKPVYWCIKTAPRWPKPKWSMRITPAPPSGCATPSSHRPTSRRKNRERSTLSFGPPRPGRCPPAWRWRSIPDSTTCWRPMSRATPTSLPKNY